MIQQTQAIMLRLLTVGVLGGSSAIAEPCESQGSIPDSLRVPRPQVTAVFKRGERLTFSVQYGLISAGEATMSVGAAIRTRQGRPTYELTSTTHSSRVFSTFFKVNDRVVSYVDTLHMHSVRFQKHLREGKFRKNLWIVFDQENHIATIDGKKECEIEPHVQDILSTFYYLRCLDLEVGRSVYVPNHDNGKNYLLEVRVVRRERVTVEAGTFDCLLLEPILLGEAVFSQKGRLRVWVTDDKKKMPVLMKSKVLVGSIAAVLTRYELGGDDN